MSEPQPGYLHSPAIGNSRAYMGSIMTLPVRGESTRGRLAVVEVKARPGNEPPPHIHDWEEEVIYVLEGSAVFYCGRNRFVAGAGDYVFLPRGVAHTMRFRTSVVRLIGVLSSAGERLVATDRYFMQMSGPATSLDLPASGSAETYATMPDLAHASRVAAEHGVRLLTPDEASELLPGYCRDGAASQLTEERSTRT